MVFIPKSIFLHIMQENEVYMAISDVKDFGRLLKMRRKSLGYTQQFLSEVSGFSASFISELENGKETAEFGKALVIANLLGLDLEVKVRGES